MALTKLWDDTPQQQTTYQPTQPQGQGLAGFLGSIGNSIGNVGRSIFGMIGTGWASGRDLLGELTGGDNINSKKYVEGKETDAFKKWLYGTDEKGKANYAKAAGQALDAAATVSNLIPGANTLAGNAIQGAVGGFGQTFADTNGDLNAAINSAGTGAITGAVTTKANQALNNVIAKNAGNKLVNNALVNNAVTRGAVSGAVGGATGGFTGTLLNGGSIQEAVGNAVKGTGQGAVQGGISGGAMALGNKVLSKVPGVNGVVEATNEMQNDFEKQRQEKQLARLAEKQAKKAQTTAQQVTAAQEAKEPELTGIEKAFSTDGIKKIENKNYGEKIADDLKNASTEIKYQELFDKLDARTAQRAAETKAPQQLTELGVKPQDYEAYAETSSYVNRAISDLARNSGVTVIDPDLPTKLSSANSDAIMTDAAQKKYDNIVKQIIPDGDTPDTYSASYLLEKSRELGSKAARLRGNVDDVKALRSALTDAKYTLSGLATNALKNNYVTGDDTTDWIANGLRKIGANEKVIDYYTAANPDGTPPAASDFIRRSSLFEQARDMGTQYGAEKLTRSASKQPQRSITGIVKSTGVDKVTQTLGNDLIAPVVSKGTELAGDAVGIATNLLTGKGLNNATPQTGTPQALGTNTSLPTNAYDFIGTREGINQVSNIAQENNLANTLSNITPTANAQTVAQAGTPLGQGVGATTATLANTGTPTTQPTQSPLDIISTAMTLALQAGDLDSMTKLMSLYNSASQIYGGGSNSSSQKLSTTQQKANAAMTQLQSLANMQPSTAYSLSGIPVIGDIARIGGDAYSEAADGLALQLGYLLSGATIKDDELARIKKDYVPQPWDSDETRQRKLQAAAALISQYQNGYMTSPE